MPRRTTSQPPPTYPIGVVARLTNIHPETLRIWERRYGLVRPDRSGRGGRLYSDDDVRRLALVKQLVDAGHRVGLLARLSIDALQGRVQAARVSPGRAAVPEGPRRVAVLGDSLPARLSQEAAQLAGLEIVGAWREAEVMEGAARALRADVLLLEYATVHAETVSQVHKALGASGAHRAVVVFGFGARSALRELEQAGVQCLQAPVSLAELRRACLAGFSQSAAATRGLEEAPARRFDPEQLARITTMATAIACECPRHLADLINSLAAFETYSSQCRNRNPKDAEVHGFLYATTGAARALIEQGLERVIELEGIKV
jgi:DNA-binding transcriptional MerR regulator